MTYGLTLALDGSTYAGSVAVIRDTTVCSSRELPQSTTPGRSGRAENFLPMVAEAMREARVTARDLDRVVCGAGPGSFTSLRVAASIAKGIAAGVGCPLFAVSSLALLAAGRSPGRYLAVLPAMRGEVYALLADVGGTGVESLRGPVILPENEAEGRANEAGATLATGVPHVRNIVSMLASIFESGPCDIDSWEPSYGRLAEAQVKWEAAHGRPLISR